MNHFSMESRPSSLANHSAVSSFRCSTTRERKRVDAGQSKRYDRHMPNPKLRKAIAAEAARLMLRRTETHFFNARNRAARWLSRSRVDAEDLPTNEEIQAQVYELAGLFQDGPVQHAHQTSTAWMAGEWEPYDSNDPEVFAALRILIERLDGIALNPREHPEGDALYHSQQVFELGRSASPYDEEFLWACLLHDVGIGIDRRNSIPAAVQVLGPLVTERTLFLIENLSSASDYLVTGRISKSLRTSEHFDDLAQLARFDRDGRIPGADVISLDDAMEYLWELDSAWDNA
jgi:hypothetical protein